MKKQLLLFLFAIVASVGTMFADIKIGDLYYNLNATDRTAEVTYELGWDENNYQGLTTANIPASVTYNEAVYSVTSIGNGAFLYCTSLTSVTIPNSVTSIEYGAFGECTSLTSMSVEAGNAIYDSRDNCNAIIETESNTLIAGCKNTIIPNSVTSIGESAFYNCSSLTSVTIPNSVTDIGNYAFQSCSSLTSVEIPNSVGRIGNNAFAGCSGLTSVTIGNSVKYIGNKAFAGCSGLTSVTIPNSVTKIDQYAFRWCDGLTSVTIGNSVTSIGTDAFIGCSDLTSVTINSNAIVSKNYNISSTNIRHIFGEQVTSYIIGDSVTSIGRNAFAHCQNLTFVTISNSVTSIESTAFDWCENLASVTIGNSVMSVENWAFRYCTSLTKVNISDLHAWYNISFGNEYSNPLYYAKHLYLNNVEVTDLIIPDDITSIRNYAFIGCSGMNSVTIHNGITSIGKNAFKSGVRSVTLNSNAIVSQMYNGSYSLQDLFGSQVEEYILGENVTQIGEYAFHVCNKLTSITIPNSVTSIGEHAFLWCSNLTSVTIGNSVISIGDYAFYGCSSLTSVTIGNSVTSIGQQAFQECSSLKSITCEAIIPPDLGNYAFFGVDTSFPLYVPAQSISAYKTAEQWKGFRLILPIGFTGFTIDFVNWDGTELLTLTNVEAGTIPVYTGKTPTRPADSQYTYTFSDWSPSIVAATADTTYTATFTATPISQQTESAITVRLDPQSCSNWSVVRLWAWTSNGNLFSAWPGIVISQDDNGWYSYTFAENIDNVNIIWTDGTNQTIDITNISESTCYALNSTSGKNITVRVVECPETSETYTITFFNYDGTELQVLTEVEEGEMPVYTGETPTRPADSQYTYTFSGWTPEITEATEDATYTATFSNTLNIYTISANAINGEVEGTGEYAYGTEVELTAIPDNGYGFAQWSDGVIDNPRTIIVTGDAEYTALFVQGQGVEDVYVSEHVKKLIIDDKMYILRDGTTYTVTGMKVEEGELKGEK